MKIRKIMLSPKRGGNGLVSSYSVNIGSDEAKTCGLVRDDGGSLLTIKCIDTESGQITICAKRMVVELETVNDIIQLAQEQNRLGKIMMEKILGGLIVVL